MKPKRIINRSFMFLLRTALLVTVSLSTAVLPVRASETMEAAAADLDTTASAAGNQADIMNPTNQTDTATTDPINRTAQGFNDIENHWARKEIKELFGKTLIDGYMDQQSGEVTFRPDESITRSAFIRYLVKAKGLPLSTSTESEFTDLAAGSQEDKVFIITAVEYGLINGYPDRTFRPESSITRAEIATILARSEMLKPGTQSSFNDIPPGYWAGDAIRAVKQARLFNGYENGNFRPEHKITRAEAVAVIYRLIHKD